MFSLKDFIMKGIRGMVGQEPDYKVIEIASGWLDKGVLTENDLADIDALLTSKGVLTENDLADIDALLTSKGVLTENDLADIDALLTSKSNTTDDEPI